MLKKVNHPFLYFLLTALAFITLFFKSFVLEPYPTVLEFMVILPVLTLFCCLLFEKLGLYGIYTAKTGFWSFVFSVIGIIVIFTAELLTASPEQLNSISDMLKRDKVVATFVLTNYSEESLTMLDALRIDQYSKSNGNNYSTALDNFNAVMKSSKTKVDPK